MYGLRHSIIPQLLSSNSSIHYFTPKAANCCIGERQTLPTLWQANCVEWPVTAAPLCLWPQCSLTPLPLCSQITMVTLLMQGPWLLPGRCYEGVTFSTQWHTFLQSLAVGQLMPAKQTNKRKTNKCYLVVVVVPAVRLLLHRLHSAYFCLWRRPFWGRLMQVARLQGLPLQFLSVNYTRLASMSASNLWLKPFIKLAQLAFCIIPFAFMLSYSLARLSSADVGFSVLILDVDSQQWISNTHVLKHCHRLLPTLYQQQWNILFFNFLSCKPKLSSPLGPSLFVPQLPASVL